MATAYLILGGNQGDGAEYRLRSIEKIEKEGGIIKTFSPVYRTEPWGFKSKDFFWNQVIGLKTELEPEALLDILLTIETQLGRTRKNQGYESRPIDIDILYYDSQIISTQRLIVPHPRIQSRRFVLSPLCDLIPDFVHPVLKKTNRQLLEMCDDPGEVFRL